MLKVLFLILVMMSSVAFAQKQEVLCDGIFPYRFFEFEKISNKLLKEKVKEFFQHLKKDNNSQGYIYFYGTEKETTKREKQFRGLINFRDNDAPKITFVRVVENEKFETVFWVVPAGGILPTP